MSSPWPDAQLRYHKRAEKRAARNEKATQKPSNQSVQSGKGNGWVIGSMYGDIDLATTNKNTYSVHPNHQMAESFKANLTRDHKTSFMDPTLRNQACSTYRGSYQIKPDAHQRRKRQQIDHGSFTGGFASDEFAQSLSKASYRRYNQDEIDAAARCKIIMASEYGVNPTRSKTNANDFQTVNRGVYRAFNRDEMDASFRDKVVPRPELGVSLGPAYPDVNQQRKNLALGILDNEVDGQLKNICAPEFVKFPSILKRQNFGTITKDTYRVFNEDEQNAASREDDFQKNKNFSSSKYDENTVRDRKRNSYM